MTRSLSFHAFFLSLYIAVALQFCRANNTSSETPFSNSLELLQEFRRHYHAFDSAVHQVANDQTDVFHLQLLLEDINEFSNLVSQHSNVFPDESEWQTLSSNLQYMRLDVQTIHSRRLEQSHHGHPEVLHWEHNGAAGRPRAVIDPDFLRWAHTHRTTTGIADFLGLSRRTVRRSLLELGLVSPGNVPFEDGAHEQEDNVDHLLNPNLEIPSRLHPDIENAATSIQSSSSSNRRSNMSNDTLDSFVRLLRSHYPRAGIQMLHGMLRRLGQVVPYEAIRQSLIRVDPVHRVFDRIRIRRRRYTVPGPNSLWHHDGHHREDTLSSISYVILLLRRFD
ncbi:hypothetical protein EV360DRAFT_91047 [Lentinula raphanica]|nr:hypothetical protein EV360DRAFT_91047 [Lentinula raphanica]